ncbi:MAG: purine-nucleoside phosphorylase [Planctomycetota bacterium]|nr:purine-nucleoside phosphorylase [Planctomycetota bacterium]
MTERFDVQAACRWIRDQWRELAHELPSDGQQDWSEFGPDVGVVLGSGIQFPADGWTEYCRVAVGDIPGMPSPSVAGHGGEWILGEVGGSTILLLGGRVHLYEGYDVEEVVRGIRILAALGARGLILTNAAGGVREGWSPGEVVAIEDHINLQGVTPKVGIDVSSVIRQQTGLFDRDWIDRTERCYRNDSDAGATDGFPRGNYAGLPGPTYETPAEVRMLRKLGADLVGMSTIQEAMVAVDCRLRVQGFSLVTNLAAGMSGQPLSHEEVMETGRRSRGRLLRIVDAAISTLDPDPPPVNPG